MKTYIVAAIAIAFATPAAAQQQPADHGSHGQHQGPHGGHGSPAQPQDHANHGQHQDHAKHADCCGDANGNGKMDCCEGGDAACCAKHEGHKAKAAPAQPEQH